MSNRTTDYFCNRELLLLLKESYMELDRKAFMEMEKNEQWDIDELLDMVYHACVYLDNAQVQKVYPILCNNGWIGDMTIDDTVIYTCLFQ